MESEEGTVKPLDILVKLRKRLGHFFLMCVSYQCLDCGAIHRLGTPCSCRKQQERR